MPNDEKPGKSRLPAIIVASFLSLVIIILVILDLKILPDLMRQKTGGSIPQNPQKVRFEFRSEIPDIQIDASGADKWVAQVLKDTAYPQDMPFTVWGEGSYRILHPRTVRYVYHDIREVGESDRKQLFERSESMGEVTGGIKTSATGEVVTYDIYFQPEAQESDSRLSEAFSYWALRVQFGFNPASSDRQLFDQMWQEIKSKGEYPVKIKKSKPAFSGTSKTSSNLPPPMFMPRPGIVPGSSSAGRMLTHAVAR